MVDRNGTLDCRLTFAGVLLATLWSCCAVGAQPRSASADSPRLVAVPEEDSWASEPEGPVYDEVLDQSPWQPGPDEWHQDVPHDATCPHCGPHGGDHLPVPHHSGAAENWEDFLSGDRRYKGPGRPLLRESWMYRPLSFGFGMGGVWGDTLLADEVEQDGGFFYAFRLGYDFSPYWGVETRIAEATMNLRNLAGNQPLHDSETVFWDFSLLYYPWGDAAWRPYLLAGTGLARVEFENQQGIPRDETAFSLPVGLGLKYRWKSWCAIRFEVVDNMILGGGVDGAHDVAFTGGVELHFGGRRLSYWPWNTGRSIW